MKECGESAAASQSAPEEEGVSSTRIDPPSASRVGNSLGKEEAGVEGDEETGKFNREVTGVTRASKGALKGGQASNLPQGVTLGGGDGTESTLTANVSSCNAVPEHEGGGARIGGGKRRFAGIARVVMRFGNIARPRKAETAGMTEVSGTYSAVGDAEATRFRGPLTERAGIKNQEQEKDQKRPESMTSSDTEKERARGERQEEEDSLRVFTNSEFLPQLAEELRKSQEKLQPERGKIVLAMQDIIGRFGAV